ncbi:MAG TPA: DUF1566 domain-containing protein [Desulfobacterales bacterium]|nr:DUF1566 domain-containing protein [Desulfobacterales bacterium]
MERKNFYLLLGLSLDPPETDPQKIEQALKKKQVEWSRYRNHPTKAILAKQYIGLIPEIRKVMFDPRLREVEAAEATKLFRDKEKKKFARIDRHLEIHMSKGFITDEEIAKLAEMHSVGESEIHNRIKIKKEEKFSEIDTQLGIRMSKGFITEAEIDKLSKRYSISSNEIRTRVKCPIRKEGKGQTGKPKKLDKSIEKVINDNLKIINKSSLYNFLDLSPSSSLEILQKKAREEETKFLKIGKKDAIVTAGEALAGHCIAIFKTEESRNAYDVSRARSNLSQLDTDIDVAGMDGKIRAEYFDILVKSAVDFGMDQEEAAEYIEDYCHKKNWNIEKKQQKKRFRIPLAAALAGILAIILVVGVFSWLIKAHQDKKEYKKLLVNVHNQKMPEEKVIILKDFLDSHKKNNYASAAEKILREIQSVIENQEFETLAKNADALLDNQNYEKAATLYRAHLSKYPDGIHAEEAKKKIAAIFSLVDDAAYEGIKQVFERDCEKRISAYIGYLNEFPRGRHREEVRKLILSMSEEYYILIKKKIGFHTQQENWEKCIQFCDQFIDVYEGHARADELKNLRDSFQKNLRDQRIFSHLADEAKLKGTDYAAAKQIYLDYLRAYPDTSVKDKIENELTRLDEIREINRRQQEKDKIRALLRNSGQRFVEKEDSVIIDKKTGLMWCLLDSDSDLGEGLNYESSIQYVKNLTVGGYRDWRLPTVSELVKIYKTPPFFPSVQPKWYWTSKSYSRYADGWSKVIDIVTNKEETAWTKEQADSKQFGTVRAVRP